MESYKTIKGFAEAEITEKKSRFIAYLSPVTTEEEALSFLENIRTQHCMARHHVFAYVLREGARVRYSDDGEPSKTAGLPTLDAIRHAELTDVVAVVVRYFGGTLLGTGGLIRAYTQAMQAAIQAAEVVTVSLCVDVSLRIPYSDYDRLAHALGKQEVRIIGTDFGEVVTMQLRVKADKQSELVRQLTELLCGSDAITIGVAYWTAF